MFGNLRIIAFTVGCYFLLASTLFAAKPPQSTAQLIDESDLVIVAQIINLEIGIERSHIVRGFGNYDWAIDLTFRITDVEKGLFEQSDTITARCFRIKSRTSMLECFAPSGNRPIFAVGTSVRAHLYKDEGLWRVVLPNGLVSVSDHSESDHAEAIRQLRSRFTYLLPLELWLLIFVIAVLVVVIVMIIRLLRRRRLRRNIATSETNAS